jgi:hypothetical protein
MFHMSLLGERIDRCWTNRVHPATCARLALRRAWPRRCVPEHRVECHWAVVVHGSLHAEAQGSGDG